MRMATQLVEMIFSLLPTVTLDRNCFSPNTGRLNHMHQRRLVGDNRAIARRKGTDVDRQKAAEIWEVMVPGGGVEPPRGVNLGGF